MAYKTHICAAFDGIYACVCECVYACVRVCACVCCLCVKQNVTKNFFHASLSLAPSLSRRCFVVIPARHRAKGYDDCVSTEVYITDHTKQP